jgi:DNA repair exonuclease SbcCD ATPase subunit
MSKKVRIKVNQGWIAYPGSTVQQNYAEDLVHGYLSWSIKDRNSFSVDFRQLPNPKPFVTVDWEGDVKKTFEVASTYPHGSRFRIKSRTHVAQQEVQSLTSMLKQTMNATEVTFKVDQHINKETLTAGTQTLARADLRNPDILMGLIRNYHVDSNYPDEVWTRVGEQVKTYLAAVTGMEEAPRNTKWSLRDLKFDNVFAYGEGNHINFDGLEGIVGIFGQNRAGKSSIVGSIMYSLFNSTDRGSIKNLHVINARKPYCYTRAIVNVGGTDYVFERQTVKHENARRGIVHAVTSLNAYRVTESGDVIDLAGEQRNDTEKVIRNLIGSQDDFLLTSLSAQGEINQFIQQGSSRRRQILSRFLDLDVFDRMYDLANKDVNNAKAQLRAYPDKDWNQVATDLKSKLEKLSAAIDDKTYKEQEAAERLAEVRAQLARHSDFTPVSKSQVESQRNKVITLERQVASVAAKIVDLRVEIGKIEGKVSTIDTLKEEHDIEELKKRLKAFNALESTVVSLKHSHEKEAALLKQQERSLKILDDVPCGDKFPTCKFIKDAHFVKGKIESQRDKTGRALEKLDRAAVSLDELKTENIRDKVEKIQKLHELHSRLKVELSNKQIELVKLETQQETQISSLEISKAKLDELEEALKNDENAEVVSLRTEIDELTAVIARLDGEKMTAAADKGKLISDAEKALNEKKNRETLLQGMKVYELVANAFSRKGIPSVIVTSQLPVINAEIAKILTGIVDFTVELEVDPESDWMDVYINYGDSRRIVELGSGMEKMISSIAIRVALINVSSLPKTDMFILDEGFGALDDAGVEACNRLLSSLKRHFRTVMIITHVDGVKDSADTVLEITKNEKDTKVVYE